VKAVLCSVDDYLREVDELVRAAWADDVVPILILSTDDLSYNGLVHPFDDPPGLLRILDHVADRVRSGDHAAGRQVVAGERKQ
jgi:hypothetical protein